MSRKTEIETRLAAIAVEAENEGADLDALLEETRSLKAELAAADQREQLRGLVAAGAGEEIRGFKPSAPNGEAYAINSEEYRTAWLKNLQQRDLTPAEQRAYVVANGAISTLVANDILSCVRDHAPLLERVNLIYSESQITYYVEGVHDAAADHTENAAITPAGDTLVPVTLSPAEIVKLVQISDAARSMSIPVFNDWLARTLGEAVAMKINSKIIAAITTAATDDAISGGITAANIQALLGAVKGAGVALLVNRATLFTKLLPLQDSSKHNLVSFAGTYSSASVYGVDIFVDDNVPDNTLLAADLGRVVCAMSEQINVKDAYDINTNSYKYLGVATFAVKAPFATSVGMISPAA